MSDEVKQVLVETLIPWTERSSLKWAIHDASRQAEDVLQALKDAGYVIAVREHDEKLGISYLKEVS